MSLSRMSQVVEIGMCLVLLLSAKGSAQTPPQPGRLSIKSNPGGATITINGQPMSQKTNAIFVVSPGPYKVSIVGVTGNPNCPEQKVQVSSGQTSEVHCPLDRR